MSLKPLSDFFSQNMKANEQNTESQRNLANELLAGNFNKSGAAVNQLSDPLVDTPMVVTLDELKPYELNPRLIRNPMFDEIKASIRERGLDAPPAITRRPGAAHYIIRNGGNTRLTILNELWKETRDERFFRIHCLFRPWQSEIVALTGHLAENELHGKLVYIERALAIEKIQGIYEQELHQPLNQLQLAQKLTADGYPIERTEVSRLKATVEYLLPVIPNMLYDGMGMRPIRKLLSLRKTANDVWDDLAASKKLNLYQTFDDVFSEVLSTLDEPSQEFDFSALNDQLTAYIAQIFDCNYVYIAHELSENRARKNIIESPPSPPLEINPDELLSKPTLEPHYNLGSLGEEELISLSIPKTVGQPPIRTTKTAVSTPKAAPVVSQQEADEDIEESAERYAIDHEALQGFINDHILSPVETTARLSAIQGMVSDLTGDTEPNFKSNVLKSIPVQAGGLYAVSDIWHIGTRLDNAEQLRLHIGQLVLEIAEELGIAACVETTNDGLGFQYSSQTSSDPTGKIFMNILQSFSGQPLVYPMPSDQLLQSVTIFLTGCQSESEIKRLSDIGFVKLMRILRLVRRLFEREEISHKEIEKLL